MQITVCNIHTITTTATVDLLDREWDKIYIRFDGIEEFEAFLLETEPDLADIDWKQPASTSIYEGEQEFIELLEESY